MNLIKNFRNVLIALIIVSISAIAQPKVEFKSLDDLMPNDPNVRTGVLRNGLTYYIKHNKKPENRAELRLVVKAGSVLEDEDQKGLAHFCEHMAFNGTKNFPKSELVSFLETIGMRFGADLNAYTSFDETVYMLTIPLDNPELLDKGFLVLEDWASNVSFEPEEIEKERGVILEEWRLGKDANERVMKKHFPVLFHNSKYAERHPIGDTNVILRANYNTFLRFYKEWYRPELMAVIAVGDFNVDEVEQKIINHFGKLENPQKYRPRVKYEIPKHDEILVSIATDKELQMPMVLLFNKLPELKDGTFRAYRQKLLSQIFTGILNNRFNELRRKLKPPFIYGMSEESDFLGNIRTFMLISITKEDGLLTGYKTLLEEVFRIQQHGVTKTEFERQKKEILRTYEKMVNEKDKIESINFVNEFQRHFLKNEAYPGIEYEYELVKILLNDIKLEEVNQLAFDFMPGSNAVVLVSLPEKENVVVPTEKEIKDIYFNAKNSTYEAYKDKFAEKPLFKKSVEPGKVVKEKKYEKLNVIEWTLSNGVRVILKPTDFKNDEILMTAYSFGGTSLSSDNNFTSASYASEIIEESGLGEFDQITLEKWLAGKIVSVSPYIDETDEGFNGSSTPADFETMLQMIHLYFTDVRKDKEAYESLIERLKSSIQNRKNSPEQAFRDTITVTVSNYHFRRRPLTEEVLEEINLDSAYNFYKNRFADASDFTFIFVGNFKTDSIKPLIEKYLGSLPSLKRNEKYADNGITFPKGIIKKEVKKGIEKKSSVEIRIVGDFDWSNRNRYLLNSLREVLNIRLRELIREEKGGTYGVYVYPRIERFPKPTYSIVIGFGCNPDRVDELVSIIYNEIENLKKNLVDDSYIQKVKEIQKREKEVRAKENSYWLNVLNFYYMNDLSPMEFFEHDKYIESLNAKLIRDTAKKYLDSKNIIQVVLYPEEAK